MADFRRVYPNLSAGELDEALAAREDLDFYDKGLKRGRNIVCVPTGGFRDRGGFVHVDQVRGPLQAIDLSAGTLSAGSGTGGTPPAFGVDAVGDPVMTLSGVVSAGDDGVLHLDAGAPVEVSAVDVTDFTAPGSPAADAFQVDYSADDTNWFTLDRAFMTAGELPQTRRAAGAPGTTVTARFWRLRTLSIVNGRQISATLKFWRESAELSPVKLLSFSFDTAADYLMVHTAGNVEVYSGRVRVASIPVPHGPASVPQVSKAQSLDTLILFHPDHPPWRVFRYGGDSDWDGRALTLENVPLEQFDGEVYTNGTNERQEVLTLKMDSGTDRFSLSYAGKVSPGILYDGDNATTAANIQAALEQVEDVGAGNVIVTRTDSKIFTVEFVNDLGQQEHPVLSWQFLGPGTGDEILQVSRVQEGKKGGEPIISATRGWPACGVFAKARLMLGGLRSRPATVLMSVQGDYFNFDEDLTGDGALSLRIDDDQVKRIRQIYSGRSLGIFTNDAEFWITDRVIAKGSPISFARGSRRGILLGLDVIDADDRTLFVQADGSAVRAFSYSEDLQSFDAPSVSRLAPHLVNGPLDWAARRAPSQKGADMVFIANQTGRASVFAIMADEDFFAWHDWDTDGVFLSFGVEGASEMYAAVERVAGGATTRRLEVYDEAVLYDAAVTASLEPAQDHMTGLDHLEGKTVELWLDGRPWGAAVVSAGAVAFPAEAGLVTAAQLGLGFEVEGQILDARDARFGPTLGQIRRYIEVELSLIDTGSVQVEANGGHPRKADLRAMGASAFASVDGALFTGAIRVGPLLGFAHDKPPKISQPFRAPLHVKSIAVKVRLPNV